MTTYRRAAWHSDRVVDERGASVSAAELLDHANKLRAVNADLLAALADAYEILADIRNEWPGRCRASGQMKLARMRDALAAASGHASVDVQDSLGRVARARGEG